MFEKAIDKNFWNSIKNNLKAKNSSNKPLETWFEPVDLISSEATEFGHFLRLGVPTPLHQYWLTENFLDRINMEIAENYSGDFKIEFVVTGQATGYSADHLVIKKDPQLPESEVTSNSYKRDKLYEEYTFGTFVVGRNNEFAHAACFSVAERPGGSYNPLFICGPTGLGKTHLLNAVGNYIRESSPGTRICYLSAERFLNECISGIRRNTMDKFRARYRERCDVLLIDDIQTLGRGEAVQDEFFHTLNDFFESRRQVVVASDRMPNDIEGLEDRIRSRLQWGLIADIKMSDMETRVAILKYKAERKNIKVPDDVVNYIASISKKSIRELEGNLNKVKIFTELQGTPPTIEVAKKVLGSHVTSSDSLTVDEVQKMTAEFFGVRVLDLKSKNRSKPLVTARQVAMYLIKKHLDETVTSIGRAFNKDHSTVINALQRIEYQRTDDKQLDSGIATLESRIQNILGL